MFFQFVFVNLDLLSLHGSDKFSIFFFHVKSLLRIPKLNFNEVMRKIKVFEVYK